MTEPSPKFARRTVLGAIAAATVGACSWEPERIVVPSATGVRRSLAELEAHFVDEQVLHVAEARAWIVPVNGAAAEAFLIADDRSLQVAADVGYLALSQKCPHLGCRVPSCESSGLFECPCHASKFTRYGEWLDGPAPRGLDRIPVSIDGDDLVIEQAQLIPGTPQGFHPSGEEAVGPSCIGADGL